jgi:hypothetical protein
MGGMTVLMTVSSASTLFGGGDVDNLVERTLPIIQSRPPKAIECRPAMSVWVTVLHYSMRAIVPSPKGFSPSIDNRVGIVDGSAKPHVGSSFAITGVSWFLKILGLSGEAPSCQKISHSDFLHSPPNLASFFVALTGTRPCYTHD